MKYCMNIPQNTYQLIVLLVIVNKLRTTEMRALRAIMSKTLRIHSQGIRTECNV